MVDTRWQHPFTAIIAGPTCSGKSHFVRRFIVQLDDMCQVSFDRILFYYAEWQAGYAATAAAVAAAAAAAATTTTTTTTTTKARIEFREGLPRTDDYSLDNERTKLIVLDDLMRESSSSNERVVLDLFTRGSHHKNISVIFVTQNVFHQGKAQRDISLNCKYLVLFKNPRDRAQIQHLARQVAPEDPRFLQEAYLDATRNGHSYLFLDLSQTIPDEFRYRTNIFPDDVEPHYVYVPRYFVPAAAVAGVATTSPSIARLRN